MHDRMHMWPFSKSGQHTYLRNPLIQSSLQQEATNKSGAASRVDVDVVDPMIFQDHSKNCYVNGLEDRR